jgi:hypothetical protein
MAACAKFSPWLRICTHLFCVYALFVSSGVIYIAAQSAKKSAKKDTTESAPEASPAKKEEDAPPVAEKKADTKVYLWRYNHV